MWSLSYFSVRAKTKAATPTTAQNAMMMISELISLSFRKFFPPFFETPLAMDYEHFCSLASQASLPPTAPTLPFVPLRALMLLCSRWRKRHAIRRLDYRSRAPCTFLFVWLGT
jgi:hypothetical protein